MKIQYCRVVKTLAYLMVGSVGSAVWAGTPDTAIKVVTNGATEASVTVPKYKYYRFALRDIVNSPSAENYFQISELSLYDAAGNRINKNLTRTTSIAAITDLPAGSFWMHHNGTDNGASECRGANSAYAFDDDLSTKLEGHASNMSATSYEKMECIDMRLADDAPVAVAYNIATAADTKSHPQRNPHWWYVFGSNDGTNWDVLDSVEDDRFAKLVTTANKTYFNGGRPIPFVEPYQYLVQEGGILGINGAKGLDEPLNLGGSVSIAAGATAVLDVLGDDSECIGGLAGNGNVVKTGDGVLTVDGANDAFTGIVDAKSGQVRFAAAHHRCAAKYYVLRIKEFYFGVKQSSNNYFQFSELALFDAKGERVNLNLKKTSATSLVGMNAGEFLITGLEGNAASTAVNMFDGNLGTKIEGNATAKFSDASKWSCVYMRLADDAPEVVGYNLATGSDTYSWRNRNPVAWRLESSTEGVNWTTLDERDHDYSRITWLNSTWFNGGKMFPIHAEGHRPIAFASTAKYFRFNVLDKQDGGTADGFQLSELALYDVNGNQVNLNLTDVGNNKTVADLTAGSFTTILNGTYTWPVSLGDQRPQYLFDGNLDVTCFMYGVYPQQGKVPSFVMRLADNAAAVASYNLATGGDTATQKGRQPTSWTLQDSVDGVTWRTVASETDSDLFDHTTLANKSWINNGLRIGLSTGDVRLNSVPPARFSLSGGATLTFPHGMTEGIEDLSFDCTESGVLENFIGADGMSLYLSNLRSCLPVNRMRTLPLKLAADSSIANAASWNVFVDGEQKNCTLGVNAEGYLTVVVNTGMMVIIK